MPLVTYQSLCIDAVDVAAVQGFWASTLGYELGEHDADVAVLRGSQPGEVVWINRVPEPRTVKQRVHIDVRAESLEPFAGLERLTAEGQFRWTTLADPEGGEFCVFERAADDERLRGDYRLYEIVVDSAEPRATAAWWADALGATYGEKDEEEAWVEQIPGAPFDCIVFGTVPEPKTVKNRIHWDVKTEDLQLLLDASATVVDRQPRWTVMADPEGNEFCAFVREGG